MNSRVKLALQVILVVTMCVDVVALGRAYIFRRAADVGVEYPALIPDPGAPKLVLDEEQFNFGKVVQGERVEHVFGFHNQGKKVLKIFKLRTSCGCTASVLSSNVIAPGGHGSIKVTLSSAHKRGPVQTSVELISNDPYARHVVTMEGNVEPLYWLEPDYVDFGRIQVGKRYTKTVILRSLKRGIPFKLGQINATNPAFTAKKLGGKGEVHKLSVSVKAVRSGPAEGVVTVVVLPLQKGGNVSPVIIWCRVGAVAYEGEQ